MNTKAKQIPYDMMNFVAICEDNYRFFFFIRPRRFGKSLTISMLHYYYDINAADKFIIFT